MPTNANTFNSRVTSEALEKKFRDVFPAQGGAELVQDLYASGVVQPVIDFSSVAEGSVLPEFLQRAWDFSTGSQQVSNSSVNIVTNPGFWQLQIESVGRYVANTSQLSLTITDGLTVKDLWLLRGADNSTGGDVELFGQVELIVFVRSGDTLTFASNNADVRGTIQWRQIADVNGNLSNPLGFVFS